MLSLTRSSISNKLNLLEHVCPVSIFGCLIWDNIQCIIYHKNQSFKHNINLISAHVPTTIFHLIKFHKCNKPHLSIEKLHKKEKLSFSLNFSWSVIQLYKKKKNNKQTKRNPTQLLHLNSSSSCLIWQANLKTTWYTNFICHDITFHFNLNRIRAVS